MVEVIVGGTLVGLVLFALLAVVLTERWLRGPGLDRMRTEIATGLSVPPDRVDVEFDARRLLPVLLGRSDARVRVHAFDVPLGGEDAQVRELHAHLHGVRGCGGLRPSGLALDGGRFEADLDERELAGLLPLRGIVSRAEVREDGLRLWTIAAVPIDADVMVTGEQLLIQPDPVQMGKILELPGLKAARRFVPEGLQVPLPELPLDASIREIGFAAGSVHISGIVPPQELYRDGRRTRARHRRASPA